MTNEPKQIYHTHPTVSIWSDFQTAPEDLKQTKYIYDSICLYYAHANKDKLDPF
jgi:hypothetical protein